MTFVINRNTLLVKKFIRFKYIQEFLYCAPDVVKNTIIENTNMITLKRGTLVYLFKDEMGRDGCYSTVTNCKDDIQFNDTEITLENDNRNGNPYYKYRFSKSQLFEQCEIIYYTWWKS